MSAGRDSSEGLPEFLGFEGSVKSVAYFFSELLSDEFLYFKVLRNMLACSNTLKNCLLFQIFSCKCSESVFLNH